MKATSLVWTAVLFLSPAPAVRADRQEIVIAAKGLAPAAARAERPTPGKWWLKTDAKEWGAPNGIILLAGQPSDEPLRTGFWDVIPLFRFVPHRVPTLVVDPKATGW